MGTELDVTVLRHAGCMQHLNCETTRQRLVNAFAVGLPTVLWHEQGFLDVVAGSDYPAVARNIQEAVGWVARIVSDEALRGTLHKKALRLAQPYALSKMSERLALVLAD